MPAHASRAKNARTPPLRLIRQASSCLLLLTILGQLGCSTAPTSTRPREFTGDGRKLITISHNSWIEQKDWPKQSKHWFAHYPEDPELERLINTALIEAGYDTEQMDTRFGNGWYIKRLGMGDINAVTASVTPRPTEPAVTYETSAGNIVANAVIIGAVKALTGLFSPSSLVEAFQRQPKASPWALIKPLTADDLRYMPPNGLRYYWTRINNPRAQSQQECLTVAYSNFSDEELRKYNTACIADVIKMPTIAGDVGQDYWTTQHLARRYFIRGDINPIQELPVARLTELTPLEPATNGKATTAVARVTVKMHKSNEVARSEQALLLTELKPNDWVLVAKDSLIGFVLGPDEDQ